MRGDRSPETGGDQPAVVFNEVRAGVKARRLVVLDFAAFAALIGAEKANKSEQSGVSVPAGAGRGGTEPCRQKAT